MAYCEYCNGDIPQVDTCDHPHLAIKFPDSHVETYSRVPAKPTGTDQYCPGCGVKPNGIHHYGCDQESCPKCGKRLILCHCFDDARLYVRQTPELPPWER